LINPGVAQLLLSFAWNDSNPKTRGASHRGLGIYIKKYLKAKEEELWKLKYFTMPKYDLQKIPSKRKPKSFKIL
jgi:hypothetical protein